MNNANEKSILKNNRGVTLLELLITIAISAMVLSMLTQMLSMNLLAKQRFDYENRMIQDSYIITEKIRTNLFHLQPHSITIIEDSGTQTVIHIVHEYDLVIGSGNVIERDESGAVTDILIYDKINETLTYYFDSSATGQLLHSSSTKIETGSSFQILDLDPSCSTIPDQDICKQGILRIEIIIAIELPNGERLESKTFLSTLIV